MEDLGHTSGGGHKGMSPVSLAFIGDGVYELMVRERLLADGSMPAGKLHAMSVRRVKATAQAAAFEGLLEICSEEEREILRRGRNANLSRLPRSCTPEEYHKATAIEALFGYLYLEGRIDRLQVLFNQMEDVANHENQSIHRPGSAV